MLGSITRRDSLEEEVTERTEAIASRFNLGIGRELESVETGYLEKGVIAQTRLENGKVEIVFDRSSFFELPEVEKERVTLHELLHVKQFNRTLSSWLSTETGVKPDKACKIAGLGSSSPDIEGDVEFLVDRLMPGFASSYPHQKERRERELMENGFDIDTEIVEEIKEKGDKVMEQYATPIEGRAVYGAESHYFEDFSCAWTEVDSYLQ